MMRKRYSVFTILFIFSITACSDTMQSPDVNTEPPETMVIQKVDVPKYQEYLNDFQYQGIWEFVTDDAVEKIEIKSYNYANGKWIEKDALSYRSKIIEDLIAIGYDYLNIASVMCLAGGCRIPEEDQLYDFRDGYHQYVSWLEDWTEIEYGKEIPLTMQILSKDEIKEMPSLDVYLTPEKIGEMGLTYVSVVTVTFYDTRG